jgi:hypothetical protein
MQSPLVTPSDKVGGGREEHPFPAFKKEIGFSITQDEE